MHVRNHCLCPQCISTLVDHDDEDRTLAKLDIAVRCGSRKHPGARVIQAGAARHGRTQTTGW